MTIIHLTGRLTDVNGNGIPNAEIKIDIDECTVSEEPPFNVECTGVAYDTVYTDENGYYNYTKDLGVLCPSGYWFRVYAKFLGNNTYKPADVCKEWDCGSGSERECS